MAQTFKVHNGQLVTSCSEHNESLHGHFQSRYPPFESILSALKIHQLLDMLERKGQ